LRGVIVGIGGRGCGGGNEGVVGDGGGAGGGDRERGTNALKGHQKLLRILEEQMMRNTHEIKEKSNERCLLCLLNFGDFGGTLDIIGMLCELVTLLQTLAEVSSRVSLRASCSAHVRTSSMTL
jgi:hypothetical protein